MNKLQNHLPRDLMALRYLDALNAGDLEAVAALWEEASHDPELERMLAELDGALFLEEAGALPEQLGQRQRRWAVWVGALAAACLLAVFAWPRRDGENPILSPPTSEFVHQVTPRPPDDSVSIVAWREARQVLDGAAMATFTWPLQEMSPMRVSTSIPPDLLD